MPESRDALDLVKHRFADLAETVEQRYRHDGSFRILCRDYGDCVEALERLQEIDSAVGRARKTEYAELRDELEAEIKDWLARNEVGRAPR